MKFFVLQRANNEFAIYGEEKMRMGFAEADITPKIPVTLIGFNRTDNTSRGILDSLMAQVSVWEHKEICCLVAIDNIGFNKKEANLLRDMIGATIGTSREKVMLSFSHTHAAANVVLKKRIMITLPKDL